MYWLRTQHPDAVITTEIISHENTVAVFKAYVAIPGGGSSTGWGSEGYDDFRDYLEKAETKALGRALAALGLAPSLLLTSILPKDRKKLSMLRFG